MSRVDPTVRRETLYILTCTVLLSLLLQAIFLVIGYWDYTVLLGNLLSASVAVANFFLMGLAVQKAAGQNEKQAADTMKLSHTLRTMMQFVVVVIGVVLSCFHTLTVLIPLFFPRIAIAFRPLVDKARSRHSDDAK